jgi:DNA-binding NarL/FixJ family response regulator
LIVEDFEPYRALIVSLIKEVAGLEVVRQVSDGVSAIAAAEELKTPLILMDIGLPELNGIEAARRIRRFLPDCKILFISQESSPDIIQEALALGNCGYVVKSNAATDLLPALTELLQNSTPDKTDINTKVRGKEGSKSDQE